ncbi:hypothetical protein QE152_g27575 [Popillia japonica]|uniref:Uncharacterized protein n=1 Tax=Popillia japonica TaxID=7064 RepID=A0AAW1JV05_POPJA
MFDLTPTSRIRRKIKTKVATFGNRIQSSKVFGSFQDLSILDKDKIRKRMRKFKCTSSDIDDYDSDESNHNVVLESRTLSISRDEIKSRLTLNAIAAKDDDRIQDVTDAASDKNILCTLGNRCHNQFQRVI